MAYATQWIRTQPLPPHVQRVVSRGREYFYLQLNRQTADAGLRIRIMDPWSEDEVTRAHMLANNRGSVPDWQKEVRRAYTSAKGRARASRLEFAIDQQFLAILLNRQGYKCAVSGLGFEAAGYDNCHMQPFALSIDRVDPSKPYTKDNVRLVCQIANLAMGQWGLPAVEKLAQGIETQRRKRTG